MTDITLMKPEILPFERSEHCIKEIFAAFAVFCAELFQGLSLKIAHNTYFKLNRVNVILVRGPEKTVCTERFWGFPFKFVHMSPLRLIRVDIFCMYETVKTFLVKPTRAGSTQWVLSRGP